MKTSFTTSHHQSFSKRLGVFLLAFFVLLPAAVQGRTFNPHNIITDEELFNGNGLSRTAIQKFLENKNSVLAKYSQVIDGVSKNAAEIIWEVGRNHNINQKFLLTTLEKEQGLVSRTTATEKALDWATGFGCYGGTCREQYKGFYNQLDAAAETQEIYREKAALFAYKSGKETTTVDGYKVTPANQATANLYIYTPHVGNAPELGINQPYGANKLFWRIWHRYFSHQPFLDGQVLSSNGSYWLIKDNMRHKFATETIYSTDYPAGTAIGVAPDVLATYPEGEPIRFSNNTLVKSSSSGQTYLIEGMTKRPILDDGGLALVTNFKTASADVSVASVHEDWLAPYDFGAMISSASIVPQGKLVKDQSGTLWFVKDGLKHEVASVVWQNRFAGQAPEAITASELEQYLTGAPAKLKDGTFVVNGGNYYLITDGERMKINNLDVFTRLFGTDRKNAALSVSTAVLEYHPAGEIIEYIDDTLVDPPTPPSTPTGNTIFAAEYSTMQPDGLILMGGNSYEVSVTFKNTGNTTWHKTEVTMSVFDQGRSTSLFNPTQNVQFAETSVAPGQTATFTTTLNAPATASGALGQFFALRHNGIQFAAIGKFVIVKPAGDTAEIVKHTIPIAVKNTWGPQAVEMHIKNTGKETVWLSRRTALEVYNADGTPSMFYDPSDWVRKEVAAVPVNATQIKPGETGVFKFTLLPKGVKKGTYALNFKLKLLDKDGKEVYLNGMHQWQRMIRVD